MLLNPSQYSPQGPMAQFAGPQAGIPQMGPGFLGQPSFGQPVAYGGNGLMQYPFGTQQPFSAQPYPFAGQTNPYLQAALQSPFQPSSFQQNPLALNPYLQNQLPTGHFAANPLLASTGIVGGPHPAQHVLHILGQLAQHNFSQSVLTQQIDAAIQQLAQIVQTLQSQQSLSAGQGFGPGGQSFGQGPFASPNQAGYGALGTQTGFGPQAQGWSSNRQPTIQ